MKDHPNLADIEIERAAMFEKVKASQGAVLSRDTKYQQCLISPVTDNDGTTLTAFDRTRKPTNGGKDWANIVSALDVSAGKRCQYAVDVYDGPQGKGFIVGARVVWDKKEWRFQEHVGPEKLEADMYGKWVEILPMKGPNLLQRG